MKLSPLARIALACAMAGALLIALAYWWFDNLPHELIGSLMFTLLGWHLWTSRRWFTRIATGKYDLSRTIVLLLHFALLASMVVLFVTSIVISKAVFSLLPFPERIYLSDVHWFAAYWTVVLIGIHLGLHWRRVMAIGFSASRMPTSRWTIWPLRVIAMCLELLGARGLDQADLQLQSGILGFQGFRCAIFRSLVRGDGSSGDRFALRFARIFHASCGCWDLREAAVSWSPSQAGSVTTMFHQGVAGYPRCRSASTSATKAGED